MLNVSKVSVAYGQHPALKGVSIKVNKGEIVVILGANGAGKSSLLRAISGTCEGTVSGDVAIDGLTLSGLPSHQIVQHGIALVPEGRGVFPDLTVHENLVLGAYTDRARVDEIANMDRVLSLFPKLVERQKQIVRTMSGGEQQMVAIGRAMMSSPQILMLDEPSLGLSPLLCKELFHNLGEVRKSGIGILLVEQNAKQSLAIADRGYLLENAHIVGEDTARNLANDPAVQRAYLGVSAGAVPTSVAAKPAPQSGAHDAAQAAANSALSFISVGSGKRRPPAQDIVNGGLDELVQHAASISATRAGADRVQPKHHTTPLTASQTPPEDRLSAVLAEIEQAAVNARKRPAKTPSEDAAAPKKATPPAPPETFENLPKIEVWRRTPSLEIYRRSNGKLKRVEDE